MHAVIVSEEPCYPPNAGNRIRALNLMLQMASRHQITYICRDQGRNADADQTQRFLKGHGIDTLVVRDPVQVKKGLRFYFKLAGNLFSGVPYSVKLHNSPLVHEVIRNLAGQTRVDLWQFEWLPYLEAVQVLAAPTVLIAHNVEAPIWQRYHETETQPLKRWYIGRQWRKFQSFERRICRQATRVVAVSDEDAALLRRLYEVPHVTVVDNGVDNASFQPTHTQRNPKQILFLGALDYRPNQDAARRLLDELFPAVQVRYPDARLVLVGRNPPDWFGQRVAGLPGVELHANVPDVRPYLWSSGVMAVPLRVGGGSRLKILEALASGLPVVSTGVGAEGLHLTPGRDLLLVDRPEEMAGALIEALAHPVRMQHIAEQGRQVARQRYDWSVLGDKLEQVWQECVVGARQ